MLLLDRHLVVKTRSCRWSSIKCSLFYIAHYHKLLLCPRGLYNLYTCAINAERNRLKRTLRYSRWRTAMLNPEEEEDMTCFRCHGSSLLEPHAERLLPRWDASTCFPASVVMMQFYWFQDAQRFVVVLSFVTCHRCCGTSERLVMRLLMLAC